MTTLIIIFLIFVFLMSVVGVVAPLTGPLLLKIFVRVEAFYCLLMSFYLILLIATGIDLLSAVHA